MCENFRLESTEYIRNRKLKREEIPTFEFYFLPLVRNEGRESLKSLPKRRRLMQQRVKKERKKERKERATLNLERRSSSSWLESG